MALRASYCPNTSQRSGTSSGSSTTSISSSSVNSKPRRNETTLRSCEKPKTSIPGIRFASAKLTRGTMARVKPASFATTIAGSAPEIVRMRPSRLNSPSTTVESIPSLGIFISPASSESATARSKPLPRLGSEAGERATVVRLFGHPSPELMSAERTRSRDSDNAASGRPSKLKAGTPSAISASTSTTWPATPRRAIE